MRFFLSLPLILVTFFIAGCSIPPPLIEQIKAEGNLKVITRNAATVFYEGPQGLAGFEYELVNMFADELGVKAEFIVPERFDHTFKMLINGHAHMAAAGLTITPERERRIKFGPAYQEVTQQIVYRGGNYRPRKVEDLYNGQLEVIAATSHEEKLKQLAIEHPELSWTSYRDLDSEELIQRVNDGAIDYTIADSNEVAVNRRYYPMIRVAFDLTEPQQLAWAFAHSEDFSLYRAMQKFFRTIREDGRLDQLLERYYGHVEQLNFVDTRTFKRHIKKRLPKYQALFQAAAEENQLDWQLLAAIGYQESHWNPRAKSPTGVRGIMMLTLTTARDVKVKNRLDPEQSIMGGARYIRYVENRIPERIQEPDRIWLALAAYNIGFAHLEDARILTEHQGGDPDKWVDIKKRLPLLSKKRYYKSLKHGYARGYEAVKYVDNIRSYYELLKWAEAQANKTQKENSEELAESTTNEPLEAVPEAL